MTTVELPTTRAIGQGERIRRTVRLQFANTWSILWTPCLILGAIFLGNFLIWAAIALSTGSRTMEGTQYSGSEFFIFVYMMIIAIQSTNLTFPFALGLGSTRRDFYLGSLAAWLILAVGFTIGLTLLAQIEVATHGWGFGGTLFNAVYFGGTNPLTHASTVFTALIFFQAVGAFVGAVYLRWRQAGLLTAGGCAAALIVAFIIVVDLLQGWGGLWAWIVDTGVAGLTTWSLIPTVVFAVLGYAVLRRATPRS